MNYIIKFILLFVVVNLFITSPVYSVEKEVLLQTTSTWDGVKYNKLRIKQPEVTVLSIIIPAGESLKMHKHDLVNVAYVQKGILTVVTDENVQITVKEGECLPEVIGKYHYGKNLGNVPVELIVFYVGEKGTPLSVNK